MVSAEVQPKLHKLQRLFFAIYVVDGGDPLTFNGYTRGVLGPAVRGQCPEGLKGILSELLDKVCSGGNGLRETAKAGCGASLDEFGIELQKICKDKGWSQSIPMLYDEKLQDRFSAAPAAKLPRGGFDLAFPSLPFPPLPFPSLPFPSLPFPPLPSPSLPFLAIMQELQVSRMGEKVILGLE